MDDKSRSIERALSILLDSLSAAGRAHVRRHLIAQGVTLPKPNKGGRRLRASDANQEATA